MRAGQLGEVVLAGLGERRLGEFFEEGVRFAVEDAIALLDGGAADRLGKMTLPGEPLAKPLVGRVFLPEAEGTDGQRGGTQRS